MDYSFVNEKWKKMQIDINYLFCYSVLRKTIMKMLSESEIISLFFSDLHKICIKQCKKIYIHLYFNNIVYTNLKL